MRPSPAHVPSSSPNLRPERVTCPKQREKLGIPITACRRPPIASAPASRCAVKAGGKKVDTPWVYRPPRSRWGSASPTTLCREQHAPARHREEEPRLHEAVCGCGLRGCSTGSGQRPTGKGAPGIPGRLCQPGTPAMGGATPEAGPAPGWTWSWPYRPTCPPLEAAGGAAERGWGSEPPAPSTRLFEAFIRNTGAGGRAGKARGQEAREPPTQRPGPHAAADGASESEAGTTVHTGPVPQGEGPEPVASRRTQGDGAPSTQRTRTRSTRVEVGARGCNPGARPWGGRRHGNRRCRGVPGRATKGVEPDAVTAARPVLNGGREDTYSQATRLAPTQPRFQQQVKASVRLQQISILPASLLDISVFIRYMHPCMLT